jgi:hypothetical protein
MEFGRATPTETYSEFVTIWIFLFSANWLGNWRTNKKHWYLTLFSGERRQCVGQALVEGRRNLWLKNAARVDGFTAWRTDFRRSLQTMAMSRVAGTCNWFVFLVESVLALYRLAEQANRSSCQSRVCVGVPLQHHPVGARVEFVSKSLCDSAKGKKSSLPMRGGAAAGQDLGPWELAGLDLGPWELAGI